MLPLSSLLQISKAFLRTHCGEGDTVVDATMGNGHDTVFLAQLVGKTGRVISIDVQNTAVQITKTLLEDLDLSDRVTAIQANHTQLGDVVYDAIPPNALAKGIAAVVFNLGFLPGSNKQIVTSPKTTLIALDSIWPMLRAGGLLSVHTYSGHPGAEEESEAVSGWMRNLFWREAQVAECIQHNKPEYPEKLYLAVKAIS